MLFFFWVFCGLNLAQAQRFIGNYPLSAPHNSLELKPEYQRSMTAIAGGVLMLKKETTPKKREDPEALIKSDYETEIEGMMTYAGALSKDQAENKKRAEEMKKILKLIKSSKYDQALSALETEGASLQGEVEAAYFIWRDYLADLRDSMPWTLPKNQEVSRMYRTLLNYVSKNHERLFGPKAELGAISADAAQALSNALENPKNLSWKGERQMNLKKDDQLCRLANNVAYLEWRLHDPTSAQRSALIDRKLTQQLKKALFDVVRSIMEDKENWAKDATHGLNLQELYHATQGQGWKVDGINARKKS
jgi:hypothetical protein